MTTAKSIVTALMLNLLCWVGTTGYAADRPNTNRATVQTRSSAGADQQSPPPALTVENPPDDGKEPPVKKKKYTPAASLIEALTLAAREDTDADAYLAQAKTMIGQAGVDGKAADARGRTALHWAVIGAVYADKKRTDAYADLTELLLAGAGLDINAEDAYGNTALDYQDYSSAEEMLELLLENGARHGAGQDAVALLENLLGTVSSAAAAGEVGRVRAALAADLPLATLVPVKLTTLVSSKESRAGDPLAAVVAAPVVVGDRVVIPAGAKLEGTVLYTNKSADRFERAQLVLDFANLIAEGGKKSALALHVVAVDNAKETVVSNRIVGVSFPNNALSQKKVTWGMRLIGMAVPTIGYAMEAATTVYGKKFDREIRYEAETDMTLQVMIPAKLSAIAADAKGFTTFAPSADLIKLAGAQPQRVDTKQGEPLDVTNVMLIGSRDKVEAAFGAAGWEQAKSLGLKSGLETFAAILFKQGYEQAPFSSLYLAGRPPDLTYQKQLNTFAKRNHIRIWKVGEYEGRDVWLGSATHDIGMGIDRSGVKPHWYHTVDIRVDGERERVLNDLMFAGGAKAYALVERPQMPKHSVTPSGNPRDTDGRMLVLRLD